MGRISIGGVLGVVAVVAFGLAGLVRATSLWAGITFTLMMAMLLGSVVGLVLRGWRGGGWLGFAVFGWGFFIFGSLPGLGLVVYSTNLSATASQWVFTQSNTPPTQPPTLTIVNPSTGQPTPEYLAFQASSSDYQERSVHSQMIGRWLWILLFAGFGAILGVILARP